MTEMIEAVHVAKLGHYQHEEDTCPFCQAPDEPSTEENDLTDDFSEDDEAVAGLDSAGIVHENKSGKLATDMEKHKDFYQEGTVKLDGIDRELPVKTAAHHLIPGNGSLRESAIMDYLHIDGMAEGNIGYNVNNHRNGVWLAGNYAFRGKNGLSKWGNHGAEFKDSYGSEPKDYAFKAIEKMECQFHDAHENYSKFVLDVLDAIAMKMNMFGDVWCPKASDKPKNPEDRQLFMLVNRLHVVSDRMRRMLTNPNKSHWKKNIYTSEFSEKYIDEIIYKK